MSDLRSTIKDIQRHVGAEVDGVFGPATAARVIAALRGEMPPPSSGILADLAVIDARSQKVLLDLDPKAVPLFCQFLRLAKATASTLGCDYILIGGQRSWEEQDALYEQGRTKPGKKVTTARGGYSNHNFKIAGDFGVFLAGDYLDNSKTASGRALAAKVHKACSEHARACGLEWGGTWNGFKDLPHYEVATGLSMAAKRKLYSEKGTVLP
jgi:peptidoglycan L-alanyl-D-glutamate endopeptidase CwlK